jgi:hypothetical protein
MHITLKKYTETNAFSYKKVASNEQKNVLCKENLSFLFKETDQRAIRTFYFRIIKLLALEREHFLKFKDMVSNIYNSWPKYLKDSKIYLQKNDNDHSESMDLAAEMSTEIERLNPIADLLILETHVFEWQVRYKNLLKTLENLFFNAMALVTAKCPKDGLRVTHHICDRPTLNIIPEILNGQNQCQEFLFKATVHAHLILIE